MNLQKAKQHFKTAYTVRDVSPISNCGEVIIYSETIKETTTVILCRSSRGVIILHDKETGKTAEITKLRCDRDSVAERAIYLIKQIAESGNDNPAMMHNIVGKAILLEAEKINDLCR